MISSVFATPEPCPLCNAEVLPETRETDIPGRRPRKVKLDGYYCSCGNIWSSFGQRAINKYRLEVA